MSERLFSAGERLQAAKLNRLFAALGAAVPEAPIDGNIYVRQDELWLLLPIQNDAPSDGSAYVREDGDWAAIPRRATIETVSTTTHAPATGTDGRYFRCTNAAGCAVTIPANATQAFPIGTMLTYEQVDADSAVTFAGAGGVTLRFPAAYTAGTAEQYAVVQVCKVAADEWVLYGHLLAA